MTEMPYGEAFRSLDDALPIALIATPRSGLTTCSEGDWVVDVIRDTREADYDYVPATHIGRQDEIVGVLKTKVAAPVMSGTKWIASPSRC